jgi:hypothetical protein
MPIMSKNIFIVKCDRETFERSFNKKKNTEVINHYEIHQKLTNNDISKTPPTPEIVEYQIVKRLNNFRDCRRSEFVFFLQEKIDKNFVNRLKYFFGDCFVPVYYHLLSDKEIKDTKLMKEFNSIHYLEDDKITNPR